MYIIWMPHIRTTHTALISQALYIAVINNITFIFISVIFWKQYICWFIIMASDEWLLLQGVHCSIHNGPPFTAWTIGQHWVTWPDMRICRTYSPQQQQVHTGSHDQTWEYVVHIPVLTTETIGPPWVTWPNMSMCRTLIFTKSILSLHWVACEQLNSTVMMQCDNWSK